MKFSPSSKSAGKNLLWCIATPMVLSLLGCSQKGMSITTASSAVSYWATDTVVIVADGLPPGEMPGWLFWVSDGNGKRGPCNVRFSSPEEAHKALGQWASAKGVGCIFFPGSVSELVERPRDAPPDYELDHFSRFAAARAKETGKRCLMVFTPPDNYFSVRSGLIMGLGFTDDTKGFLESLAKRMGRLTSFLRSLGSGEADPGARSQ